MNITQRLDLHSGQWFAWGYIAARAHQRKGESASDAWEAACYFDDQQWWRSMGTGW